MNTANTQQHKMKLATEPHHSIASGKKVIESRLFDEKRQTIAIGDQIVFSEDDKSENNVTTVVKGLLHYQTFKELFADHDPALFGGESRDFLLDQIKQFYSDEDEQRYGVVGLRLQLLDSNIYCSVILPRIQRGYVNLFVAQEAAVVSLRQINKRSSLQ